MSEKREKKGFTGLGLIVALTMCVICNLALPGCGDVAKLAATLENLDQSTISDTTDAVTENGVEEMAEHEQEPEYEQVPEPEPEEKREHDDEEEEEEEQEEETSHVSYYGTNKAGSFERIYEVGVVYEMQAPVPLLIERVDRSIKHETGVTVGLTYYDKPILTGDSDAVSKMNEYFQQKSNDFFFRESSYPYYEKTVSVYEHFSRSVMRAIESGFLITEHKFINTSDTNVTYSGDGLLSFLECWYWNIGGVTSSPGFGTTFDVQTGELITLDYFVTADIDEFKEKIVDYYIDILVKGDYDYYIDYVKDKLGKMSYTDYEYYYDGDAVYLLFNSFVQGSGCHVLRWDLQTGEISDFYLEKLLAPWTPWENDD